MKEIVHQLEVFQANLAGGRKLVKAIEKESVCAIDCLSSPYLSLLGKVITLLSSLCRHM